MVPISIDIVDNKYSTGTAQIIIDWQGAPQERGQPKGFCCRPADHPPVALLRAVLALAAAGGILTTLKLWVSSHRLFPLTPIWGGLLQPPFPWDYVLVGLLLTSLAAIGLAPRAGLFIKIFLALLAVLAALDQCRWQPWVLQYAVMFGALLILPWNRPLQWTARETAGTLDACRLPH